MNDNTQRFSDRVEDYIKYRPTYPKEIINILEEEIHLDKSKTIADIGSGTGISSKLFLENDFKVIGVEPNKEMREAAEQLLSAFVNFTSVNGTGEKTNLPDDSIDMIFCAQAFHWFDKEKSKIEFERILKNNGHIVLIWNARVTNSDFLKAYERVLYDNIEEYKFVNHRNIKDEEIANFFFPKKMHKIILDNKQFFDLEGLKGRLTSSSYCPKSGLLYDQLMKKMEDIFDKYQRDNAIEFEYETQIYWC